MIARRLVLLIRFGGVFRSLEIRSRNWGLEFSLKCISQAAQRKHQHQQTDQDFLRDCFHTRSGFHDMPTGTVPVSLLTFDKSKMFPVNTNCPPIDYVPRAELNPIAYPTMQRSAVFAHQNSGGECTRKA